jgi:hypothetical protein
MEVVEPCLLCDSFTIASDKTCFCSFEYIDTSIAWALSASLAAGTSPLVPLESTIGYPGSFSGGAELPELLVRSIPNNRQPTEFSYFLPFSTCSFIRQLLCLDDIGEEKPEIIDRVVAKLLSPTESGKKLRETFMLGEEGQIPSGRALVLLLLLLLRRLLSISFCLIDHTWLSELWTSLLLPSWANSWDWVDP